MARATSSFWRARGGAISIEFAVIAPVMALMSLGAIELVSYSSALSRADDAAEAVGMVVSRAPEVDAAQLKAAFGVADRIVGAHGVGAGLDATSLQVSSVIACPCETDPTGLCFRTLWSKTRSGMGGVAAGRATGAAAPEAPGSAATRAGETLIVVEAGYAYKPALKLVLGEAVVTTRTVGLHRPTLSDQVRWTPATGGPERCSDF